MPHDFNQQVIEEFRANGGRVGGPFEGGRLLLLTTTGARTGAAHTTPLAYLPDGERVLVIASAGGSPRHPHWYRNLVADPRVTVENGVFTLQAKAVVLEGAERDAAFARAVETDPGWADYASRSGRTLPVVALEPVPGVMPTPAASSFGQALKAVHDAFRRELGLIRQEIAAAGPGLGTQLRVNCLSVCGNLHHHHVMEDSGMFPSLAGRRPELAPVIERLGEEHRRIAELVARLREVVSAEGAEPAAVLAEVDRLAGELEEHLTYEEEQLIPVLDGAATA
ncbi:nitroreductase/quinone reductase family protein [Nonomuraea rhodomycinica]|uniref:Nitroreductase family deazaflavin-dependent oxidoreductase n=1 Tax=Nonomuraea rhodomycinica TaxID=1712872 RepID=A0A7Y6MCS4_9ACTN|nr:nitroreductase/quinone reductase family protein [Nonomuraea rhodomycinica]NUW41869.1 nitroreductase family deazaflavin-dependent oxidoreductase [Nonomuraea rhodomycinica]